MRPTPAGRVSCSGPPPHSPPTPARRMRRHPRKTPPAPGATVTISGLVPGTYTVWLVGFCGGGAAFSAQVSGVSVVAGQNTTPALPALVASFGVTVSPGTGSIAPGATQQFTAVAKDAQGNTISPDRK